jgi:hypothetical protein
LITGKLDLLHGAEHRQHLDLFQWFREFDVRPDLSGT